MASFNLINESFSLSGWSILRLVWLLGGMAVAPNVKLVLVLSIILNIVFIDDLLYNQAIYEVQTARSTQLSTENESQSPASLRSAAPQHEALQFTIDHGTYGWYLTLE